MAQLNKSLHYIKKCNIQESDVMFAAPPGPLPGNIAMNLLQWWDIGSFKRDEQVMRSDLILHKGRHKCQHDPLIPLTSAPHPLRQSRSC